MATVTAGTGATINATTAEGQLWQLIHVINNGERGLEPQKFTVTKSEDYILEASFSLPGAVNFNASTGTFTENAQPYLSNLSFTPGSPVGTFKSITLSQYLIDVMQYIIMWQNTQSKNPQSLKNVGLIFDWSLAEYRGSIILPYQSAVGTNGAIVETATEWLQT